MRGVDLVVERGRVYGLLGPNGAGKTTLVKVLLGIVSASAGRAEILGCPAGDVAARARVGYLPENHRYPAHLNGEQVLRFFARLAGLSEPAAGRALDRALDRVGLAAARRTRVGTYSKGMLQRLGLAQAILHEPELLILDEPTDGVDPIGRRAIRDRLLEEKARGATIFLNSHLLSEVERICDGVAILKEGRLVREGTVDQLTRPGSRSTIRTSGLKPDYLPALQAVSPGVRVTGDALDADGEPAALNRLIDALRQRGVAILEITPGRESLEEVFVRVIGEEA